VGWRLWRRVRIAPGVTINISKSGLSTSIGPRGIKATFGRRATRLTAGLPGTGLFYTTQLKGSAGHENAVPAGSALNKEREPKQAPAANRARRFWNGRSPRGKVGILTAGVVALLLVGSTSGAPGSAKPSLAPLAAIATIRSTQPPAATQRPLPTATVAPRIGPTPNPLVTLAPTLTPPPNPTPAPTPLVVTFDDPLSISASKTSLSGAAGTYTWSSVSFGELLGKVSWLAKASAGSNCALSWSLSTYDSPISGSSKVGPGRQASASKQFEIDYADSSLAVKSNCPVWSISLTSYAPPPYWNPWGYNFTPGYLIYSPPGDFCSYFDCIPSFWNSTNGYVIQCADLMFSHSGGRSGSCSYHGGNYRALYHH
jgi:hypothetical protein